MNGSRAFWLSVVALVALAGALTSCAKKAEPTVAAAQCYWLSNEGEGWVARPDLANAEACFEMDSCAGGRGLSAGGCYKWTAGADTPASPWADLGLTPAAPVASLQEGQATPDAACYVQQDGVWLPVDDVREAQCFARDACAGGLGTEKGACFKWATRAEGPALPWRRALTHPKLAADVPPPKDLYVGSYEMTSDCPEKGCAFRAVRYRTATPLHAEPDTRSRIVTTAQAGECAQQTGVDRLVSAPRRGVVLETLGPFVAGDVIYLTNAEGEGISTVWRRGAYLSLEDDSVVVRWDAARDDPRAGYWVEVKRANGETGWARNPDEAESGCKVGAK